MISRLLTFYLLEMFYIDAAFLQVICLDPLDFFLIHLLTGIANVGFDQIFFE